MADSPTPSGGSSFFSRKIGPVPVWMIGAGGLVLVLYLRQKKNAAAAATAASASPDLSGAGSPIDNSALPGFAGGGGGGVGGVAPGASGTAGTFQTNTDWATAAINALIGHGYDPGTAANAIANYLAGGQLSAQMQAAISDAIRYAGAPPNAVTENLAPPTSNPAAGGMAPVGGASLAPPGTFAGGPGPQPPPGPPADTYHVGQQIAGQGTVTESLFSPLYGWLNQLSNGAIYTGGGGQPGAGIGSLSYGGSYLGYLASLPAGQRATEQSLHGSFAPGGLALLPGGGYVETNTRGEQYSFGH